MSDQNNIQLEEFLELRQPLKNTARSGILTTADEIYDESLQARQSDINEDFEGRVTNIEDIIGTGDLTSYRTFTIFRETESDTAVPSGPATEDGSYIWNTVSNKFEDHAPDDGWTIEVPTRPDGHYMWAASATFSGRNGKIAGNWAIVCVTGSKGGDGSDGSGVEFIYTRKSNAIIDYLYAYRKNSNNTYDRIKQPSDFNNDETTAKNWWKTINRNSPDSSIDCVPGDGTENGHWYDNPQGVEDVDGLRTEWASLRTSRTYMGISTWSDFCNKYVWSSWGTKGTDGDGVEYIFLLNETETLDLQYDPSRLEPVQSPDYEPTTGNRQWSDDPQPLTASMRYQFVSQRKYNGQTELWEKFSSPSLWNYLAKDGTSVSINGTVFNYWELGNINVPDDQNSAHKGTINHSILSRGDGYMENGYLWVYDANETKDPVNNKYSTARIHSERAIGDQYAGFTCVGQIQGPPGETTNLYIRFANKCESTDPGAYNFNGTWIYFTPTAQGYPTIGEFPGKYAGYQTSTGQEIVQMDQYTWTEWRGDDILGTEQIFVLSADKPDKPVWDIQNKPENWPSEQDWNSFDFLPPLMYNNVWAEDINHNKLYWSDKFIEPTPDKHCWTSTRRLSSQEEVRRNWQEPAVYSRYTSDGIDGDVTEFIYHLDNNSDAPSINLNSAVRYENGIAGEPINVSDIAQQEGITVDAWWKSDESRDYCPFDGTGYWTDNPSGVDAAANKQYEHYCQRTREYVGDDANGNHLYEWTIYANPKVWSHYGEDGKDGDGVEYIYYLAAKGGNAPSNPTPNDWRTNANYQKTDAEYIPDHWSDDPQDVDENNPIQYVSVRKYRYDDTDKKQMWGRYSNPKIWTRYTKDGTSITPKGNLEYASDLYYIIHDGEEDHLGDCYFISKGVIRTEDCTFIHPTTAVEYPNACHPKNDANDSWNNYPNVVNKAYDGIPHLWCYTVINDTNLNDDSNEMLYGWKDVGQFNVEIDNPNNIYMRFAIETDESGGGALVNVVINGVIEQKWLKFTGNDGRDSGPFMGVAVDLEEPERVSDYSWSKWHGDDYYGLEQIFIKLPLGIVPVMPTIEEGHETVTKLRTPNPDFNPLEPESQANPKYLEFDNVDNYYEFDYIPIVTKNELGQTIDAQKWEDQPSDIYSEPTEYECWQCTRNLNSDYKEWSKPVRYFHYVTDGTNGLTGIDSNIREYCYLLTANADTPDVHYLDDNGQPIQVDSEIYQTPDYLPWNNYNSNSRWDDTAHSVSYSLPYEWIICRERTFIGRDQNNEPEYAWQEFDAPKIHSHWGEDGKDGDGIEYIYILSANENIPDDSVVIGNDGDFVDEDDPLIINPISGSQNPDYTPTKPNDWGDKPWWTDNPVKVSTDYPYQFVSKRKFIGVKNGTSYWTKFTYPKYWNKLAIDGKDDFADEFVYACNDSETTPPKLWYGTTTPNTRTDSWSDFTGNPPKYVVENSYAEQEYRPYKVQSGDDKWTDDPSGVTNAEGRHYEWQAHRTYDFANSVWGPFVISEKPSWRYAADADSEQSVYFQLTKEQHALVQKQNKGEAQNQYWLTDFTARQEDPLTVLPKLHFINAEEPITAIDHRVGVSVDKPCVYFITRQRINGIWSDFSQILRLESNLFGAGSTLTIDPGSFKVNVYQKHTDLAEYADRCSPLVSLANAGGTIPFDTLYIGDSITQANLLYQISGNTHTSKHKYDTPLEYTIGNVKLRIYGADYSGSFSSNYNIWINSELTSGTVPDYLELPITVYSGTSDIEGHGTIKLRYKDTTIIRPVVVGTGSINCTNHVYSPNRVMARIQDTHFAGDTYDLPAGYVQDLVIKLYSDNTLYSTFNELHYIPIPSGSLESYYYNIDGSTGSASHYAWSVDIEKPSTESNVKLYITFNFAELSGFEPTDEIRMEVDKVQNSINLTNAEFEDYRWDIKYSGAYAEQDSQTGNIRIYNGNGSLAGTLTNGQDGATPTINASGYWEINGSSTGVKARGEDGNPGSNGHDGVGVIAEPLQDGSGYHLKYTNNVDIGNVINGANGSNGHDGQDGHDGRNGSDGENGISTEDVFISTSGSMPNLYYKSTREYDWDPDSYEDLVYHGDLDTDWYYTENVCPAADLDGSVMWTKSMPAISSGTVIYKASRTYSADTDKITGFSAPVVYARYAEDGSDGETPIVSTPGGVAEISLRGTTTVLSDLAQQFIYYRTENSTAPEIWYRNAGGSSDRSQNWSDSLDGSKNCSKYLPSVHDYINPSLTPDPDETRRLNALQWESNPQQVDLEHPYLWMAAREWNQTTHSWGGYSAPVLFTKYAGYDDVLQLSDNYDLTNSDSYTLYVSDGYDIEIKEGVPVGRCFDVAALGNSPIINFEEDQDEVTVKCDPDLQTLVGVKSVGLPTWTRATFTKLPNNTWLVTK